MEGPAEARSNGSMTSRLAGALALVLAACLAAPRPARAAGALPPLEYVSPVPGAADILPETNIIVRPGGIVDPGSIGAAGLIQADGSQSGTHTGRLRLSDDGLTITFRPDVPFLAGETVTCRLGTGLRSEALGDVPAAEWTFTVAGPERAALRGFPLPSEGAGEPLFPMPAPLAPSAATTPAAASDTLPADYPHLESRVYGNPAPGRIFLAGLDEKDLGASTYLSILNDDGTPYFLRKLDAAGLDFKWNPNGLLTYFDYSRRAFYALDSTYAVVDSFRCGNGYDTDLHDIVLLPDGHALLMSYDPEKVDMRPYVPKGYADAIVLGLVIQEIDRDKDVVFQWRSWDHFQITDAIGVALGGVLIDPFHGNSLDVGPGGNILLSSRHLSEVTKISRSTGEILWRLGGVNNQFRFINDPIGFSYQHDAKWLPDGHLTLYDNGVLHSPQFSRAVEYEIDEQKMTAKLVWEYRHDPDVFGFATGSVQRLSNGNTLIGWGFTTPTLTEVTPDKRVVMEMSFDPGIASYRAYRFEWPPMKSAVVDLSPRTVNLGGGQGWITAMIESDEFADSDVVGSSVRLAGVVPADPGSVSHEETIPGGSRALTLRFAGDQVVPLLRPGDNRLEVSGDLATGGRFHGFGLLTAVVPSSMLQAAPLRLVSAPGTVPVELELDSAPIGTRAVAVYDVRGRLVQRWRSPAGRGRLVSWDGRAKDGRRVGTGVYFVRLEDPAAPSGRAAKVVVAR
jgi:hypothetical protein